MRAALVAVLLSSGCVCTPLSSVCGGSKGPCPTEADLVKQGLQEAEAQWIAGGSCAGPVVGSTQHGSWVNPGPLGFCGDEYFFSRTGRLMAKVSCCEGDCQEWGIGFRMKRGPVTRQLCDEAKTSLVLLGATARVDGASRVVSSDGTEASSRVVAGQWQWTLPFGHFTVEYADRGQQPLVVALGPDGGLASPSNGPGVEVGLLFHRPGAPQP